MYFKRITWSQKMLTTFYFWPYLFCLLIFINPLICQRVINVKTNKQNPKEEKLSQSIFNFAIKSSKWRCYQSVAIRISDLISCHVTNENLSIDQLANGSWLKPKSEHFRFHFTSFHADCIVYAPTDIISLLLLLLLLWWAPHMPYNTWAIPFTLYTRLCVRTRDVHTRYSISPAPVTCIESATSNFYNVKIIIYDTRCLSGAWI